MAGTRCPWIWRETPPPLSSGFGNVDRESRITSSPLERAIGREGGKYGSDPITFRGKDWGVIHIFHRFLFDDDGLSQVPILDSATMRFIQPNTLVRFRGMIQDMPGNEFYVGAYKDGSTWRTNKFMDVSQFPIKSSSDNQVWERHLLHCIPVPGQNKWTHPHHEVVTNQFINWASQHPEKRRREDDAVPDHMDLVSEQEAGYSSCSKKMREGELPAQSGQISASANEGGCSRMHPTPDVNSSFSCLVKIYDAPESDLKLNDVFEFIGVYTFDPELKREKDDPEDDLFEDVLTHLPPSKVPRLHCFVHRKLANSDFLSGSFIMEPKPPLLEGMREALLMHFTSVLGNDGLAANFMLLHLLSRVRARVDTVAVGKFSLNLTCLNKGSAATLSKQLSLTLRELLPFTSNIPLTVEYLNSHSLCPRKDYQTNRLVSGVLQLAEGSHLTIDETQLEAGTLNPVGVENARLLKSLTESQKVEYDFTYYKMDMAADVQLLILSDGKSNILPADVVLPFHPSSAGSLGTIATEALEAWRWYFATLRSLPHSIGPEMQEVVENDLVAARQADRMLGSQDFSRLLTMGCLVSLSFCETSLSMEHWQMVKELEVLRRERLTPPRH